MNLDPQSFSTSRRDRLGWGYLPTLDGWRAIAISCVIAYHAGLFYFSAKGPHPSRRLQAYVAHGRVGVDVFFAISGFLICTLLLREQEKTGSISLRSFYVRRIFRILPPYLLYLMTIGLLASGHLIVVERREWIACLFFFRNYLPWINTRDIGWYTGHFWSLAVEERFYLLWPGILLVLKRRRAAIMAIALITAVAVWRTIDLSFALVPRAFVEKIDHRTDLRMDSLLWGCLLAIAYSSEAGRRWLKRWISPHAWIGCVAALPVLTSHFIERNNWFAATAGAICPPLFAVLVVATVVHPQWPVGRFLEDKRLRWIGRISYSLYIWQQLFLVGDLVHRPLPFGRWQEVPLAFIGILACAMASYYLVERPLVRVGHRLASNYA